LRKWERKEGEEEKNISLKPHHNFFINTPCLALKVLVTPLPIPSRKAVFEHQKKSHAPPECGDFPHTLVHVLHVSATPWKLTSPIIFVLLLILVLQHLIVLHQYNFFYFSKPSINLALESSLDIMRSPYQDNQNKLLSQIPNKDNVKGWN
jgi:hypothetical protein